MNRSEYRSRLRAADSLYILVDGIEMADLEQRGDSAAVAAAAKGGIDIYAAGAYSQPFDGLG